jgi:hypothetical protein
MAFMPRSPIAKKSTKKNENEGCPGIRRFSRCEAEKESCDAQNSGHDGCDQGVNSTEWLSPGSDLFFLIRINNSDTEIVLERSQLHGSLIDRAHIEVQKRAANKERALLHLSMRWGSPESTMSAPMIAPSHAPEDVPSHSA